ncbi:MAG: ArdC-like ssDNA-binding domain-containing protein [Bacteroidetes bacterium]|jgi:hypothetical protein|nr:ArdC-like ssDNA-binding domain-containing protein [Bacteroidota bacterium]
MMSEAMKEKRAKLGALTAQARKIKEKWVRHFTEINEPAHAFRWSIRTINSIIVERFYKNEENAEFKTFNEWRREGYKIKKGSKGFLVWGRPLSEQKSEQEQEENDEDGAFYPISYVFSNAQVERMAERVEA